ncbi:MAG: 3-deoxy-8-phosphooctulonate synthase [Chitinispirillaceae bacterium]|jgi:2-dehydro-3-deoxyphosphooctonate aldolase (KDO 8-P synthase)|nr:3-deoxy-8-phosphooctulonate synthase [Chitinispirillaceae bacterium]
MLFPLFKHISPARPNLFIIAGPCVIESEKICRDTAAALAKLSAKHKIDIIFKASYEKANRLAKGSFRGIGQDKGLKILASIKKEFKLPVLTDIHESWHAAEAAEAVDILQIPALLCRQTDLLEAAGETGKWVNIKKGQFMAPEDMEFAIGKAGKKVWVTDRGSCFGYRRLVVDFAGIPVMKEFGVPVIFDATHSVQIPGGGKGVSSGNRDLALPLAKAALAMGVDGLFFEVHPDPDKALCDGPNSLRLDDFARQVPVLLDLYQKFLDQ